MTTRATVPEFAHPYAHPVDNRAPAAARYGPHDPSNVPPPTIVVPCAGKYPLCNNDGHPTFGRHDVALPTEPRLLQQRVRLNTLAHEAAMHANTLEDTVSTKQQTKPAGTYDDPLPWLSGWCNPGNDDMSHARCGTWYDQRGSMHRCTCSREGCSCNKQRVEDGVQQSVNNTLDNMATTQTTGTLQRTALRTVVTTPTAWTADEVADLMVELEACPLCEHPWPAHTFTDDDRVVCAA